MPGFNHEVLEVLDIVPAFIPVDMQTAANAGSNWLNMGMCAKALCVIYKAVGTAGDDPVLTLSQATDGSGTATKALSCITRTRTKIGAIATAANQIWTLATQAAGSTYTPTSAASAALITTEVQPNDLDVANGFNHIQMSVPDTGTNAQLGCAFYIAYGLKYAQSITPNNLL